MSNHVAERPTTTDRVAKWIRRLCVPIVLFWVAVAALTNVLVPQLEAVGAEHNVALSSPESPSLQAFQRIGKVFHEFDSDSAAMVVLEGDQPLGAEAHHYYDDLVKRIEADTKHVQHVQDFWGDPLTAAGSQSPDGKAAYVQVFLVRQPGRGVVAGVGRRAARHHRQDAGPTGYPCLRRRLGSPDRRSVRGGQREHRDGHPVDRRGHRRDVAHRLPLAGHHDPGARHGAHRDVRGPWDRRVPGERRSHRPVDVFDQHPHAAGHRRRYRLHHLPARPLSRAAQRRHGPGGRLLRHVPRDVARDTRVRA